MSGARDPRAGPRRLALAAAVLLPCCGKAPPQQPELPPLPPLQLAPLLPQLQELAARATPRAPDAAVQNELRELADIALQQVEVDPRTAARAERSLVEHPQVASVLVPALQHADPIVRQRAAWLCGRTGRAILAFPLLLRQKDEPDAATILWIASALHALGNDSGLSVLDAAMNVAATAEPAGQLAIELLRAMGATLGEAPTYLDLQTALRARSHAWARTGIGAQAAPIPADPDAVAAIVAAHLATTEGTALRPVDEARFVLVRSGILALPMLQRALAAKEPYLRTMALQVLAELGPAAQRLGSDVLPLLGDPLTASYALRALGELGATALVVPVRARLDIGDTELRAAAANALGLLRDTESGPRLAAIVADEQEPLDVRVQAAFARLCLAADATATAFLAERERRGDYHAPTLQRLRDRLAAAPR